MPGSGAIRQKLQNMALISIAVAFVVMGLKYAAYHVTGSVALYSDALESIVNVITAFVAWYAISLSFKPGDSDHPFGHHKAEYFSAVVEGVLIVVAALLIAHQAWGAWTSPKPLEQTGLGLAVNGAATVINGVWATHDDPRRNGAQVSGDLGRRQAYLDRCAHVRWRADRPVSGRCHGPPMARPGHGGAGCRSIFCGRAGW